MRAFVAVSSGKLRSLTLGDLINATAGLSGIGTVGYSLYNVRRQWREEQRKKAEAAIARGVPETWRGQVA